jgi:hypothetical protein
MYLPDVIADARILITVKTYPLPSSDFGEVVCTAGLLNGEKWIRIYPILLNKYIDDNKFPKYGWAKVNLVKHPSDDRVESYMPRNGVDEPLNFLEKIGTANFWAARKDFVKKEIFTSMEELISLMRNENRSLGTLKPVEIIDFLAEDSEREWKPKWAAKLKQMKLFDPDTIEPDKKKQPIKKIPYTFKYRLLTQGDTNPRELSILDWEIGMLYWNCLRRSGGDEKEAIRLVRKKYFDEFVAQKDILLFLGTNYQYHKRRVANPFMIIGVFYPPKTAQLSLFHNP